MEQLLGYVVAPAMTLVIGALAGSLKASLRRERDRDAAKEAEHKALCMGMREMMRRELYEMHRRYVVEGEPMPYEEKEREDEVYRVYHSLGGNGTGTHVHQELQAAYVGGQKGEGNGR